jgi:hypothetical protein
MAAPQIAKQREFETRIKDYASKPSRLQCCGRDDCT